MSALPAAARPLSLWERLLVRDPLAWSDLCTTFLDPLMAWLGRRVPYADADLIAEAAENALLGLAKNPQTYNPRRASLEGYLRLSARGDLLNLLQKERRRQRGRCDLKIVELGPRAGKYLGRDEDPSWRLRLVEEGSRLLRPPVELSAAEGRVWELMQRGERRTPVFAEALGLSSLPQGEQRAAVKRVKDRITKRLERAGGES
jgi:hypothetical protein